MTNSSILHTMGQILDELRELRIDIAELKKTQINANSCVNGDNNDSFVGSIDGDNNFFCNVEKSSFNLTLTDTQFSQLLENLFLPFLLKRFFICKNLTFGLSIKLLN